jgi:hypothetical protein
MSDRVPHGTMWFWILVASMLFWSVLGVWLTS